MHFCEAYLGIGPHFFLWCHLFNIKFIGKSISVVGAVMFYLRSGLKAEWIDMDLLNNTVGWRSEWFYVVDQQLVLPKRTRHKPEKILEWDLQLTSHELDDVKEVLALVHNLKETGVTGVSVARSFYRRLIQQIKDRVHPSYEYWGQSDPHSQGKRKVSKGEMMTRVSQIYVGCTRCKKCPKAYSLSRPVDLVSSLFQDILACLVFCVDLTSGVLCEAGSGDAVLVPSAPTKRTGAPSEAKVRQVLVSSSWAAGAL
jgi:hypothetical protein